jgi:hypothetical protein
MLSSWSLEEKSPTLGGPSVRSLVRVPLVASQCAREGESKMASCRRGKHIRWSCFIGSCSLENLVGSFENDIDPF